MPHDPIAYLSAAKVDADWAEAFHHDLERCLGHAGLERRVFWEAVDIGAGQSIPRSQQEALDRARFFLLVATPEALADPAVTDQWESFHRLAADGRGRRILPVVLAETPLPPFLAGLGTADFTHHDAASYRYGLGRLVEALLDQTEPPELPPDLEPPPSKNRLPAELRRKLVDWLTPVLEQPPLVLRGLADALGFSSSAALLNQPSAACGASNLLVLHTGDDDPVLAALRLVGQMKENLRGIEPDDRLLKLDPLRDALERLRSTGPPTTGLLAAWLRKVHRDHERLVDFFQQRHELDLLDRVYVELAMEPDARRLDPHSDPRLSQPSFTVTELLELDPGEHPWITRRWVIRGDPGSGKTTLLRHLAAHLAEAKPLRWVPLFQSLPVLMRSGHSLLERIERQMGRAEHRGLAAVLDREGQEGRLLLLLDGLDEVSAEDREDAETLLRELAERWPRAPLIVTTRPIGFRRFAGAFRELQLLPLDRERRLEFLARWFGRATSSRDVVRAREALRELDSPGLRDLAGNPLYLTLMALLLEQDQSPSGRRSKLYSQVFELLLQGKHKHDRESFEAIERPETVRAVLRQLAWGMTLDNRDAAPRSELEERLYQPELDDLRDSLRRVPRWDRHMGRFLDELAYKVGILGPHDGSDADWRFWHRTFREALTAERLHETYATGGQQAVLEMIDAIAGNESRWAEPFALLAGQVDEPDTLVRSLVETNRSLGLRALATAQGVSDRALVEILEISGGWSDRRKVFEQIPDQLDDPGRSLHLIDRLRQRTRDGNDLYFLDLAAATVAERWPDEATEAASHLRARLFDHIDAPADLKLFQSVDTPLDGAVSLWCEVPAGEGWLGDERVRVEVVRPFRLAAVPVTNAQYAAFDPDKVREDPHHPVVKVTWYEAVSFCRWLSSLPGLGGARLPTEDEWEYACRAGSETAYWNGDGEEALGEVGWYDANSEGRRHRVGEKAANPWGLYDVHGNVWEWTASIWDKDRYSGRDATGLTVNPAEEPADLAGHPGAWRVIRGGSFRLGAGRARSAFRFWSVPVRWYWYRGFRVLVPCAPS